MHLNIVGKAFIAALTVNTVARNFPKREAQTVIQRFGRELLSSKNATVLTRMTTGLFDDVKDEEKAPARKPAKTDTPFQAHVREFVDMGDWAGYNRFLDDEDISADHDMRKRVWVGFRDGIM